ncbi:Cyclopropane-fatty-acyl-phospholipid synthase [Saliniradius amylolyticus]|uniref:Cyclopropane-fatty-acyl-phospholipid synthase n=1 Tax=Saliniradius amylolyticus TaxID=2183582 RepID=A0A2S2E632_9ALTE|nr:class I SAM-dependent methyltransferase [Saliniradius amylolyticus]AWL12992.1 Cyclopropane-fatty-acyl-phospholipid synthase [Saliniradius amylolyticus]
MSVEPKNQALSLTSEAFAEKLVDMLNNGATIAMIALGHRLGIFDKLDEHGKCDVGTLAKQSNLSVCYLEEWLSVMVTAHIVQYEPASQTFALPESYANCLCRRASPDNIAVTAQFIPMICQALPAIEECFKTGEGLPYSAYPCFHQVMSEDSHQTVVSAISEHIMPAFEMLHERLSDGCDVLDIGCGKGLGVQELARLYPNSRFKGYDLCESVILEARANAQAQSLTNVQFECRDATDFDEPESYDVVITFDAIHDQADPQGVLNGIKKSLRPDGLYLMQDIAGSSYLENNLDHPFAPLIYSLSCAHCTPVSLHQGGPGLGTMWGQELAMQMLRKAGFNNIEVKHLEHDPLNMYVMSQA